MCQNLSFQDILIEFCVMRKEVNVACISLRRAIHRLGDNWDGILLCKLLNNVKRAQMGYYLV